MRGVHFKASDRQTREVTQYLYMKFAGLTITM